MTDIRDFEIETDKSGKILNIKELCNFVESTEITKDNVSYLDSLRSKLANDDRYSNKYVNEYPLVDSLNKVLLNYYINNEELDFDMEQLMDLIYVYNDVFLNINKIRYDGLIYLICDLKDDLVVFNLKSEDEFKEVVKSNIAAMVTGDIEKIINVFRQRLHAIKFDATNDKVLNNYASNFDIADNVFYGKDLNDNMIYKIKNGLFTKNGDDVSIIYGKDLTKEDNKIYKIEKKKPKGMSFTLDEFISLRDKALNGELVSTEEIQLFYYEVKFLIDTIKNRTNSSDPDSIAFSEALDEYMQEINKIYENHPDILTHEDLKNLEEYNNKKNKIVDISRNNKVVDISNRNNKIISFRNNSFNNKIISIEKNNSSKTG